MRAKIFFIAVFMIVGAGILGVFDFALAHNGGLWTPGVPLVPCGNIAGGDVPCDKCQLWHLLKHLIDFIMVAAAPIMATIFFVIAGVYLMLGGANPGMLSTGKRMFKDTFIGLLIVMMAWLMVNTLIRSLVDPLTYGSGPGMDWYEFYCTP